MLAPHRKGKLAARAQPRGSSDTASSDVADADDANASSALPVVLPSSTELFYFYGQSLDQCAKLSTGKPLYDLCNVHKKWLKIYAGMFGSPTICCFAYRFVFLLPSEDVLTANLKRCAMIFTVQSTIYAVTVQATTTVNIS